MSEVQQVEMSVVDRNGTRGALDLAAVPPDGKESRLVLVRFGSNSRAFISSEALVALKEGGYFYPESFGEALVESGRTAEQTSTQKANNMSATTAEQLVVPVVAEELKVERRRVKSGAVRIIKTVGERTETVDLPLMEEQTEVERVAIGRIVETAPPMRYEGDVLIVPLLEEVIVTEKRLMLREELHIRKRQVETHKPQQVTLRREEVTVERVGGYEQHED